MYQIKKTKDYSMFKRLSGNRPLTRSHIDNMKKSISEDNQLNLHPIIVNKRMEVIDGQTRLRAAQEMGIEVFYIQSDDVADTHFVLGNLTQKKLNPVDFVNFYASNKKMPEFLNLLKYIKQTKLNFRAFMQIYYGKFNKEDLDKLKKGKFELDKARCKHEIVEMWLVFMDFCVERRVKPISMFRNSMFCKAFRWLCLTTNFEFQTFMEKVENRWTEFRPLGATEDIYKMLIDIYNWKNQRKIDTEFLSDEY